MASTSTSAIEQGLAALLPRSQWSTDPADCYAYSYDNSRQHVQPWAVVWAQSTADVAQVLRWASTQGVAVTARGRGTGTAGGSLPPAGGIALSLERMRQIVDYSPENRLMVVQAGVLNQEVQQRAQAEGFFWPPDPSSAAYCSVGGNLATNAGGPHAVKYGVTRDHVLGLTAVTGEGEIIHAGGRTTKGVVGYDLTRLLIGSEGTLAVITEATLKLSPKPAATQGLVASFANAAACAQAIAAIMAQPALPSALEFLDAGALRLIRSQHPELVPAHAQTLLMIEVDGSLESCQRDAAAIAHTCQNIEGLVQCQVMDNPAGLWAARKALSPLLRQLAPKKINEDVVVPVSRLPELLAALEQLCQQHQLLNVNFGHAGNGNLHVNLLVQPENAAEMARAQECLHAIFAEVLQLQGTLSGEHGVGREKLAFVPWALDASTLQLMRKLKHCFDPQGILNPGKAIPAADMASPPRPQR